MDKNIFSGAIFRARRRSAEGDVPYRTDRCKYGLDCNRDCSADRECGTKRFFERYPDYQFLCIGAMTEPVRDGLGSVVNEEELE